MTIMQEIEKRLVNAEGRVADLLGELEQVAPLERALGETTEDLRASNARLAKITSAVESTVRALEGALGAFREAVEVMRKSDPARMIEEVGSVRQQLGATSDQLSAAKQTLAVLVESANRTDLSVDDASTRIGAKIDVATDTLSGRIASAQESLDASLGQTQQNLGSLAQEASADLRRIRFLLIGMLVLSLAVLGVAGVILVKQMGLG